MHKDYWTFDYNTWTSSQKTKAISIRKWFWYLGLTTPTADDGSSALPTIHGSQLPNYYGNQSPERSRRRNFDLNEHHWIKLWKHTLSWEYWECIWTPLPKITSPMHLAWLSRRGLLTPMIVSMEVASQRWPTRSYLIDPFSCWGAAGSVLAHRIR
jgi:hypothetical protein